MKQELGWYFLDNEKHLPEWMAASQQLRDGVLQYQYHKYIAAIKYCQQRRTAIDVGANIGLWSKNMAMDFENLVAFEPVELYRECWQENMTGFNNIDLCYAALGAEEGIVHLRCSGKNSFGDTGISTKAQANVAIDVQMVPLDFFEFIDVDFIKIDCEGYENFILQGAEETIKCNKPCIIVEQKPDKATQYGLAETAAVDLLRSWGATMREEISGDYIFSW